MGRETAFPLPGPARALQGQTPLHQLTLCSPVQDVCVHPHTAQVDGHRNCSEKLQILPGSMLSFTSLFILYYSPTTAPASSPRQNHPSLTIQRLPCSQTLQEGHSSLTRTFPSLFLVNLARRPRIFTTQR